MGTRDFKFIAITLKWHMHSRSVHFPLLQLREQLTHWPDVKHHNSILLLVLIPRDAKGTHVLPSSMTTNLQQIYSTHAGHSSALTLRTMVLSLEKLRSPFLRVF